MSDTLSESSAECPNCCYYINFDDHKLGVHCPNCGFWCEITMDEELNYVLVIHE